MVSMILLYNPKPREQYETRKLLVYQLANMNGAIIKEINILSIRRDEKKIYGMVMLDAEGDTNQFLKALEEANYQVYIKTDSCKVV